MGPTRDRRILDVVRALVEGEVSTYGEIAEVAGYPGRSRLVGHLLAGLSEVDSDEVPWWRVVNSVGRLVPGAENEQAGVLRSEGVVVRAGRVAWAPIGRFSSPRRRPSPRP